MRKFSIVCIVLSLIVTIPPAAGAQAVDPGLNRFVEQWRQSLNDQDLSGYKKLIHPQCLVKIKPDIQDYYDYSFTKELSRKIPGKYRVLLSSKDRNATSAQSTMFSYPILPTHQVQLDYDIRPLKSVTVVRDIVQEGNQWYFILPEPTAETLAQFRAKVKAEEKQTAEAKQIAAFLGPQLINELKGLNVIQAAKKLEEAKSLSVTQAMQVLKELGLDD